MKGYKNIPNFEGYQISRGGDVFDKTKQRHITITTNKKERKVVSLRNGNKRKIMLVSRLVAMTWKPCEDMEHKHVHHINGDYADNRISNLLWVTPQEHNKEHQIMREFMNWAVTTKRFQEYREIRLAE